MHSTTRAFLTAVSERSELHRDVPAFKDIRTWAAAAVREAFELQELFDAMENNETDPDVLGKLGEVESQVGAVDREVRKLREQMQVVEQIMRKMAEVEERIIVPLTGR